MNYDCIASVDGAQYLCVYGCVCSSLTDEACDQNLREKSSGIARAPPGPWQKKKETESYNENQKDITPKSFFISSHVRVREEERHGDTRTHTETN